MAECEEARQHTPSVSACDVIQRELEIMRMQVTDPAPLTPRRSTDDITSWMLVDPLAQGPDPNDLVGSCAICSLPISPVLVGICSTCPSCHFPWVLVNPYAVRFGIYHPFYIDKSHLKATARLETVYATVNESIPGYPRLAAVAGVAASASFSRRGRGQRKNKAYWKTVIEHGEPQNPFERDCLFRSGDTPLTTPATSYMDSTSTIPRCMSMKFLHELGLESHLSAAFEDPGLLSIGMGGQKAKVTGIVRDIAFRLKGDSTTFKGDFYVSELLDGFYDILFGWQFMANEAADILEKAHRVYQDAKAFIRNAASKLTAKIGNVVSQTQKRVSDFVSGVSLPPPPYSLVNILEGDYVVAPRVL